VQSSGHADDLFSLVPEDWGESPFQQYKEGRIQETQFKEETSLPVSDPFWEIESLEQYQLYSQTIRVLPSHVLNEPLTFWRTGNKYCNIYESFLKPREIEFLRDFFPAWFMKYDFLSILSQLSYDGGPRVYAPLAYHDGILYIPDTIKRITVMVCRAGYATLHHNYTWLPEFRYVKWVGSSDGLIRKRPRIDNEEYHFARLVNPNFGMMSGPVNVSPRTPRGDTWYHGPVYTERFSDEAFAKKFHYAKESFSWGVLHGWEN
jgi:hypothetical protein